MHMRSYWSFWTPDISQPRLDWVSYKPYTDGFQLPTKTPATPLDTEDLP
jgi:hypothetical protein